MTALYHLNENMAHLLEGFLESAVPLIAGLAEVIGLFIIVTSLVKATYHYVRATFFRDRYDFHHEMSTGLTTALEFLMSAEIAKTFLLQNLESVIPLAATFALRALMSLLLHVEMRADHTGGKMMPAKVFFAHSFPVCAERQKYGFLHRHALLLAHRLRPDVRIQRRLFPEPFHR